MLDATAGGAFTASSYNEGYNILEKISNNNGQWADSRAKPLQLPGTKDDDHYSTLATQVRDMAVMLRNLTTNKQVVSSINTLEPSELPVQCAYCGENHLFDNCPGNPEKVNYIGNNDKAGPFSPTYNPGWREHPNLKWNNPSLNSQLPRIQEAMMKGFISETQASIKNLETQVGQMGLEIRNRSAGSLPSDTEIPQRPGKEQVKAVTLRSGKDLNKSEKKDGITLPKETDTTLSTTVIKAVSATPSPSPSPSPTPQKTTTPTPVPLSVPYPQRLRNQREEAQFKQFLDVFKQLHINIPLLEAIERMPNYTKFLKDILNKKKRLTEYETVALTEGCNALLTKKIPPKMKDPGTFTIPCSIGGEARPTIISIQLADKSIVWPKGKIEDVLVQVDKFIFPAEFIILDCEVDQEVPIILGIPFLATGRTLIDVQKGELTMRVHDQRCEEKTLGEILWDADTDDEEENESEEVPLVTTAFEVLENEDRKTLVPSLEVAPDLELKQLPSNLKYAFLGDSGKLPVIISSSLEAEQEEKSYLMGTKVIIHIDHAAIKYLIAKKDSKPRLIRWILLLQEFDLEIIDRKGINNQVADHLSILEKKDNPEPSTDICETFPDEKIFVIKQLAVPWFADIVNYLACGIISEELNKHARRKLIFDSKKYLWDDPFLFKICADQMIWICVPKEETTQILHHCHSRPCGGHFSGCRTAVKNLQSVDYVSKWVEAMACHSNDAKTITKFLQKHIFSRFGTPRALISDEGTHFINKMLEEVLEKYDIRHRVATLTTLKPMD
ncbi:hypothetical protein OSB04_020161 [Centaurea solstitialis]|uniref:Integrase catalytic domain-containing protein n=1 Tax=Centaurea solstitialis TaxID=347529 RepID=A0AA38SS61_9ASTR|nr:hypothetical protein OSB04_020161 [Centaurea solstitialis]